jgi:hypothetical protein
VDGLTGLKDRLTAGWLETPKALSKDLHGLTEKIAAIPDQTTTLDAQTFLTTAQLRLVDYREAMRKNKAAENAAAGAKAANDSYCDVMEDELNSLYDEVQKDFSTFYRAVNEDDEGQFTAKLTPAAGSLGLDVNFYDRGLFPPAAFHSEGHQDGMGVCLYLALMKRLFGKRFTFALLDDVVMSVDAGHRYQFCKLLKPTHDGSLFTRAEPDDIPYPMIVNNQPVTLQAIHLSEEATRSTLPARPGPDSRQVHLLVVLRGCQIACWKCALQ